MNQNDIVVPRKLRSALYILCTKNDDGSLTIPAERVSWWERQIATPYMALTEREKDSDREQVDRYWHLISERNCHE